MFITPQAGWIEMRYSGHTPRRQKFLGQKKRLELWLRYFLVCFVINTQFHDVFFQLYLIWTPNLEATFVDESPNDLLARGDFKQSPMVGGCYKFEGSLIVPIFNPPNYIGVDTPPFVDLYRYSKTLNIFILLSTKTSLKICVMYSTLRNIHSPTTHTDTHTYTGLQVTYA